MQRLQAWLSLAAHPGWQQRGQALVLRLAARPAWQPIAMSDPLAASPFSLLGATPLQQDRTEQPMHFPDVSPQRPGNLTLALCVSGGRYARRSRQTLHMLHLALAGGWY